MANFSSIKFNNVDYPLKDATARDDIASLQTSVSGLDTRVDALEENGVQILSLDPEIFDDTGTVVYSNTEIDFSKPIYLQIQAPLPDNEEQNVLQYNSQDGSFEFLSQYMSFDERGAEGEKIKYLDMVSTAGDVVGFRVETISGSNNLVISYPEVFYSSINNTVHTYPLPTDYAGQFDASSPDSGEAYHISDELYYDLMNNDITVLFTGSISNFVSGAQLASNKKQGRFTLILDNGQVLEFWAKDLSDYGYGKCLCYDDDYVYGLNGLDNDGAKFDTVKTRLDSSGKVVAVGFGTYPVKSISDGFSKVSGNSLGSLTLDNYDYSKGYFNGSFTYEGMTIKSQPIQGFTSLPDGPRWYGYFTSTTGDILYVDSSYSEEQGGVMVTTAQIIPSDYYEVADINALSTLIEEKRKNLTIDKPYHLTQESTYDYDLPSGVEILSFPPQSVDLIFDGTKYEESGGYFFSLYSNEDKKYRFGIDGLGNIYCYGEENAEVNVPLPSDISDAGRFESIKLGVTVYDASTPYLLVTPIYKSIYDGDAASQTFYGTVIGGYSLSTVARSLYYGLRPVIAKNVHITDEYIDVEIASGELFLEKTTKTITELVTSKTFNGGYLIKFKKPKSSPDSAQDRYYSPEELAGEVGAVLSPYLVLDGSTPRIVYEGAI